MIRETMEHPEAIYVAYGQNYHKEPGYDRTAMMMIIR